MFRAPCAHRQEGKIVLYSLWYHHTYRWPSRAQIERVLDGMPRACRCDDTRDCVIQFCPPDDEHMCSKHVDAWNKLIIKFNASSWLILINKWFIKVIKHEILAIRVTVQCNITTKNLVIYDIGTNIFLRIGTLSTFIKWHHRNITLQQPLPSSAVWHMIASLHGPSPTDVMAITRTE